MIILKILLWILLAILGIIIVVCVIPADVDFSYIDGKMKYKVKIWFFDLMDSSKEGFLDKRKRKKAEKAQKNEVTADEEELPAEYFDVYDDIGAENDLSDETVSDEVVSESETEAVTDENTDGDASAADENPSTEEKVGDEFDDLEEDEDEEPKKSLGEKLEKLGNIWLAAKNPANMIFKGFKFRNFYIDFIIANEDAYKCAVNYGRYTTLIYNGIAQLSRLFTIRFKTVDIQPGFGLDKGRWDTSFSVSFRLGTAVIAGIWFLITYLFRVLIPKKLKNRKKKKTAAVQK